MTDSLAPVALVTGTSTGIGLHTAVALARGGHRVMATMRDPSRSGALRKAADAAGVDLEIRELDVTDQESAAGCVHDVVREHGRLDVLVNNAGAGRVGTTEQVSLADVQATMDVNFFGVVRMTQLVLPVMRTAGHGRIVTISSVGGVVGQPFNDAYCAAKFAVEGLMQSLAPVAERMGVRVLLVEPGAVASEFVSNAGDSVAKATHESSPYAALLSGYMERVGSSFADAQSPAEVAEVVAAACTDDDPVFRRQTSAAATGFAGLSLADMDGSKVMAQTRGWLG